MSLALVESSNAIIAPIEIKLDKLEKLEDVVRRLRAADMDLPPEMNPRDKTLSFEGDTAVEDKLSQIFANTIGNSGPQAARNVMGMASNPLGFIMGIVSNPVVAGAILATASAKMVLDILMMHGNILDRHFKRIIVNEQNAAKRTADKQALRVGLGDQVIFTNKSGSTSPQYAFNSYAAVNDGSIREMQNFQIRRGYKF